MAIMWVFVVVVSDDDDDDDDDDVCHILDQHDYLHFHSASWLKQQSTCTYVDPWGLIILIPIKSVHALIL
jgi:hypothetical protein